VPIYTYKCQCCEGVFEAFHLMSEALEVCSLCEQVDTIEKIPSMLVSKLTVPVVTAKVGDVVENFIKDAKREIRQEKKTIKKKEM